MLINTNFKKILLTYICIFLALIVLIIGTLAYFTSKTDPKWRRVIGFERDYHVGSTTMKTVRHRLSDVPEKKEQATLLEKQRYMDYRFGIPRGERPMSTLVFEFPDGSRKCFIVREEDHIALPPDYAMGMLTYQEHEGIVRFIGFETEKLIDKTAAQEVFADAAINAKNLRARLKAVSKLTDQKVLTHIARNDPSEIVRFLAVKKLADTEILMYIVQHDIAPQVRELACLKAYGKHEPTDGFVCARCDAILYNLEQYPADTP